MAVTQGHNKTFRKALTWVCIFFLIQTLPALLGMSFPGEMGVGAVSAAVFGERRSAPESLLSSSRLSDSAQDFSAFTLLQFPLLHDQAARPSALSGDAEIPFPSRDPDNLDDLPTSARTHRAFRTFPGEKTSALPTLFCISARSNAIFLFNQAFRI